MTEPAERILNGRYRISSLIGRGGMADVYLGHDLSLDRKVAVKMLRPDLARDPQFQGRFRREGQSSASLNHPNIVAVYDSGREEVEDQTHHEVKTPYIVMEYVDGVTLRHILHGTPKITDTSDVDEEETRVAAGSSPPPPPEQEEDVLSLGDTGRVHAGEDHLPAHQVGSQLQSKIDHALNKPLSEHETAGYMHGHPGRAGLQPREGHRPPGHQTLQRDGVADRSDQGHGLRHRPSAGRFRLHDDPDLRRGGHRTVSLPRAGAR